MKAIVAKDLTKIYRVRGRRIIAVNKLNLKILEGEIFGLLGPNGAGKTTTINLLLGLTSPTSGEAYVFGFDIVRDSVKIRELAGLVPEKAGFYGSLTAYQNLKYFAELSGMPSSELDERIEWALKFVDLSGWRDVPVKAFSRGMVQRLALARVLVRRPRIIFLDEPTAGLDPKASRKYRLLIKKLNRDYGVTIVISSHMLHEVRRICHRIGFMKKGKIISTGRVEELLKKLKLRILIEVDQLSSEILNEIKSLNGVLGIDKVRGNKVYLTASRDLRLEISKILIQRGVLIKTLKIVHPTLDELFMQLNR